MQTGLQAFPTVTALTTLQTIITYRIPLLDITLL